MVVEDLEVSFNGRYERSNCVESDCQRSMAFVELISCVIAECQ